MKTVAQKKQTEVHGGMNPVVMAVTGAVIGAGIAVAGVGAVALKDEKNRQKVKEALGSAKDQAVDYIEDVQKQIHDKKVAVEKALA